MKNKRTIYGLVLVALVLMLGIGYAAVTTTNLFINGTASYGGLVDAFEVVYDNVSEEGEIIVETSSEEIDINVNYVDTTHATLDVGNLTEIGNYGQATYTVINKSADYAATVYLKTNNSENRDIFGVTLDRSIDSPLTLAPGESGKITARVELLKLPDTEDKKEANIALTIDAVPSVPAED